MCIRDSEEDEEHNNLLEFEADTHPYLEDTDADGMLDGWEPRGLISRR